MVVKCNFWSDELNKFYSLYQPGAMDWRGAVTCVVPAPGGHYIESGKSYAADLYKMRETALNYCFSHGGTTPDKAPEFAKIIYDKVKSLSRGDSEINGKN